MAPTSPFLLWQSCVVAWQRKNGGMGNGGGRGGGVIMYPL